MIKRNKKFTGFIFFCILSLVLSSCASLDIQRIDCNGKLEVYEDEARLWKRSEEFQELLNKSGYLYEDEKLTQYVNNVLHKLVSDVEDANGLKLKVYILRDPLFNAFCLANGAIYVHTSILANAENEAQLAIVLAHEASHFLYRHSLKGFRSTINKTALFAVCQVTLSSVGGVFAGTYYGGGTDLLRLLSGYAVVGSIYGYSRDLEREADENAFVLIEKAGYDPVEAKKFMENLYEATKDEKKVPYFYSSHPRIKERIKTYDNLLKTFSKENTGKTTGINNTDIYNEMVKTVLLDNTELDMMREKGLKSARRQIEKYNSLYPDDFKAYYLLGKLCVLEGDKDKAEETLRKSIELNTDYAKNYKELGLLYYKKGEKEKANTSFNKYLQLEPKAEDADYIRGYINE